VHDPKVTKRIFTCTGSIPPNEEERDQPDLKRRDEPDPKRRDKLF
jgi:hypothetical protein